MSSYVYNPFINNFDDKGSGGGGGGDVSGPGSSTDDALVRWDGAAGTLIKDSNATLDDSGLLTVNAIALTTNLAVSDGGTGASTEAGARSNLGLEIGVDVEAWDAGLDDIAGLAVTDGNFIVGDGLNWTVESGLQARTSLGLGTIATQDSNNVSITGGSITGITDLAVADGGTGASNQADARTNLGLVIGTDVQAWDAGLDDISALAVTDGNIIVGDGANWVAESGATAQASLGLTIGTNVQAWDAGLDDISGLAVTDGNIIVGDGANWVAESGATARTSLGLGSISTQDSNNVTITGGSVTGITDIVVADGGTGVSSFTAYAVICGGTTGTGALQSVSGVGTSGQVLTSNDAGALPTWQDASGGGLTWQAIGGTTQSAAVNNGYIVDNSSQTTITLPTTAAVGDVVRVAGYGAGGWIIDYGTNQLIHFLGSDSTTTTGNLTSTNRYDAVELICTVANLEFNVISSVGNITVT